MKPGNPPLLSTRLLDQLRERIRYLHYSLSTEKVYLHWVKFFIRWHGRNGDQALSTWLFLYRDILDTSRTSTLMIWYGVVPNEPVRLD